jgi:hypothetical protein
MQDDIFNIQVFVSTKFWTGAFQCHMQRNKYKLQNTNSPDSTKSIFGVVVQCGEKERFGQVFQAKLSLYVNIQRLWLHLTTTSHRQKVIFRLMPITAISILYFEYEVLLNTRQDFISPLNVLVPQSCEGVKQWTMHMFLLNQQYSSKTLSIKT